MPIPNARVSFTLRDSEGHESVMTLYADEVFDDGAGGGLLGLVGGMQTVIEGVSDAVVAKVELTRQDPTPVNTVPGGNIDNEIQAKFTFYTEDGTVATVSVPAFKRTLLEPNTNRVDTDAAAVSAFVNMILSGAGAIVDSRGADITALKSALESYSRRRAS